jgi:hypothetical protein
VAHRTTLRPREGAILEDLLDKLVKAIIHHVDEF